MEILVTAIVTAFLALGAVSNGHIDMDKVDHAFGKHHHHSVPASDVSVPASHVVPADNFEGPLDNIIDNPK